MPVYGANLSLLSTPEFASVLFNAETPALLTASRQVLLPRSPTGGSKSISLEIDFNGDPGAYSIAVQTTDTDAEASYLTLQTLSANLNAAFNTRAEIVGIVAKYVRVVLVTRTNAVPVTVSLFTP